MKQIQEIKLEKLVNQIRKDENNAFSIFLSIELKNRFEKRPVEERHLSFNQWRKLYMLRLIHAV